MKKENRIRKDFDNETIAWWLRSTNSYHVASVAYVYNYGYVSSGGSYYNGGVVPVFII